MQIYIVMTPHHEEKNSRIDDGTVLDIDRIHCRLNNVLRYYQCKLLGRTALGLTISNRNTYGSQTGMLINQVTGIKDISKQFLQYEAIICECVGHDFLAGRDIVL